MFLPHFPRHKFLFSMLTVTIRGEYRPLRLFCLKLELVALNPHWLVFGSLLITLSMQHSHLMVTDKMSMRYLICIIRIFVSCPSVPVRWIRQLEIRNPFIAIYVPLGSNSANLDYSCKVDLEPVAVALRDCRAPTIASDIVQASVVGSKTTVISSGVWRGCHLIIRNYSRRGDTNRIVEAIGR